MSALRRSVRQLFGRTVSVFFLTAIAIALTGSQSAFAGLIFTQVEFDGQVRSGNGSGSVAGVEEHFTDEDFSAPPTSIIPLPATNPPLPPPLNPSIDLRIANDFVANAPLDGHTYNRAMVWITSPTTGNVFANSLDNSLATPIDLDTYVYLEELLPDEQLDIKAVRVEVFDVPPIVPAADTFVSTNVGSAADPIHIHLKMSQDQLLNGGLKAFVYYDTAERVIPEPTTAGLVCVVILGTFAIRRQIR